MPYRSTFRAGRRRAGLLVASFLASGAVLLCSSCVDDRRPRPDIIAGGDLLFDRGGGTGSAEPSSDPRFDDLAAASRGCSAFLFNLETTIGEGGSPKAKDFVFRSPAAALAALGRLPRPVAALANNHSMDFGPEGLSSTIRALDAAGVAHAGAGSGRAAALAPAFVGTPAGRIAVISCGVDDDPASFREGRGGPVIAPIEPSSLLAAIASCRRSARAVVVMLHWGVEYRMDYAARESSLARRCVDAGADLIVGSGPHVLRGIEMRGASLICYSLGNLVFDDIGGDETATALLVRMRLCAAGRNDKGPSFAIAVLRTTRIAEGPRALDLAEARAVVERLALRSPDPRLLLEARERASGRLWFFELRSP